MKDNKPVRTFIIQNKLTKQQWKASSGKCAWKAINHAKAAWHNSSQDTKSDCELVKEPCNYYSCGYNERPPYFDEQDVYEIVELKSETMSAVENVLVVFKEIQENSFVLTDEHKEFISNFITNFGE